MRSKNRTVPFFVAQGYESWREPLTQGQFREFLDAHGANVIAKSRVRTVEVFLWEGKRYFFKGHHTGCGSPGLAEWEGNRQIRALGIWVPKAVAAGDHFFISQEVAAARSVESILDSASASAKVPRALLDIAADTARRMHAARIAHKDLYLGHLFWDAAQNRLTLIDLARVRRHRLFFGRWRVKDLASLLFSSSLLKVRVQDKIYFFKRYLGRKRLTHSDKGLAKVIQRKARRIALHTVHALGKKCSLNPEILEPTAHNSAEKVIASCKRSNRVATTGLLRCARNDVNIP